MLRQPIPQDQGVVAGGVLGGVEKQNVLFLQNPRHVPRKGMGFLAAFQLRTIKRCKLVETFLRVAKPFNGDLDWDTPTEEVLDRLQEAQDFIVNKVQSVMLVEKSRLARLSTQLPVMFSLVKTRQEAAINLFYQRIVGKIQRHIETENNKCSMFRMKCTASVESRMLREQHRLEMLGQRVDASNPERLL